MSTTQNGLKESCMHIGKELRQNPVNCSLKHKYFCILKSFRKFTTQNKNEYKKKIFDQLSDSMNKNPQEYCKILKSLEKKL